LPNHAGPLPSVHPHGAIVIDMVMYRLVCSQIDAAIDWYQKDIGRRPNVPMVAFAAFLKPLRWCPRWPKLARMMNLLETA